MNNPQTEQKLSRTSFSVPQDNSSVELIKDPKILISLNNKFGLEKNQHQIIINKKDLLVSG